MLNHHSIIHLIISLTLTLLQCSFNTLLKTFKIFNLLAYIKLNVMFVVVRVTIMLLKYVILYHLNA